MVGSNLSGWIDTRAITPEKILSTVSVNYAGNLNGRHHTINKNQPFGIRGFEIIGQVGNLNGREVRVTEEVKTDRATWAKIHVTGSNITGWIDARAIRPETVTQTRQINYAGRLNGSYHTINKNQPFGIRGFEILRAVGNLNGREVRVDQEKETKRGTWSYIYVPGTNIQGWIDRRGIIIEDYTQAPREVDYVGVIKQTGHTITNKPFGTYDFKIINQLGRNQLNQEVRVLQTARTNRASWLYIELPNKQRGWVDARAIQKQEAPVDPVAADNARRLKALQATLKPGEKIVSYADPASVGVGTSSRQDSVRRGEGLSSVAARNGISLNQLLSWNNMKVTDIIHPGQKLNVNKPTNGSKTPRIDYRKISIASEQPRTARAGKVIDWFKQREGKVGYSMTHRNGPYSYDCSSAVYYALMHAGYLPRGSWAGNTESLFAQEGRLLQPISRSQVRAGDIFVSGVKGGSLGSGGHTGVALNSQQIIHCTSNDVDPDGIVTTFADSNKTGKNRPIYWYRLRNM
ncbi:peptidoglycan amidohydrolase family protein [Hutsoniella sourekii]|uniref:peptidoglycan amidohydrolase family protein n=1 Tax=Hutsoniella sourekii TaxID=87650 RepID=UPI0004AF014D|nr:peptidoglycan amidohydrolase family protein [Hutsoniella sourekii]